MSADLRIRGPSPAILARREREWWQQNYRFTCACNLWEVRLESAGMRCAKCDAPLALRRGDST